MRKHHVVAERCRDFVRIWLYKSRSDRELMTETTFDDKDGYSILRARHYAEDRLATFEQISVS